MVCTVWFLFCWTVLVHGSRNFLNMSKYYKSLGLKMVLLVTYNVHCQFSFVIKYSCSRQLEFNTSSNNLIKWITDFFIRQEWCALSDFFFDGKCLLKILDSFVRHSWCALSVLILCKVLAQSKSNFMLVQIFLRIRFQIVLWVTHNVHCLF